MRATCRAAVSLVLLLAALCLSGCGAQESAPEAAVPTPTAAPVEESQPTVQPAEAATPTPAPESAAPTQVGPGSYRYESEEYGTWLVNLKDNGTFSLICGERIYNGEGWSVNPDGSVVTGPTEAAGAAPFFDEFGSCLWRMDGESCTPVF